MTTEELFQLLLAAREKAPLEGHVLVKSQHLHEHPVYEFADVEFFDGDIRVQ